MEDKELDQMSNVGDSCYTDLVRFLLKAGQSLGLVEKRAQRTLNEVCSRRESVTRNVLTYCSFLKIVLLEFFLLVITLPSGLQGF